MHWSHVQLGCRTSELKDEHLEVLSHEEFIPIGSSVQAICEKNEWHDPPEFTISCLDHNYWDLTETDCFEPSGISINYKTPISFFNDLKFQLIFRMYGNL